MSIPEVCHPLTVGGMPVRKFVNDLVPFESVVRWLGGLNHWLWWLSLLGRTHASLWKLLPDWLLLLNGIVLRLVVLWLRVSSLRRCLRLSFHPTETISGMEVGPRGQPVLVRRLELIVLRVRPQLDCSVVVLRLHASLNRAVRVRVDCGLIIADVEVVGTPHRSSHPSRTARRPLLGKSDWCSSVHRELPYHLAVVDELFGLLVGWLLKAVGKLVRLEVLLLLAVLLIPELVVRSELIGLSELHSRLWIAVLLGRLHSIWTISELLGEVSLLQKLLGRFQVHPLNAQHSLSFVLLILDVFSIVVAVDHDLHGVLVHTRKHQFLSQLILL